jgi:CxxC-x17-CxxC domain-containing protein
MKEFKRGSSFGGKGNNGGFNRSGSGSHDRGGFRGGSQRDFSRPTQMHEATCAQCKKICEVPFLPNGRKPVYCKDCFENEKNDAPQHRSFSRDSSGPRPSYRPDREERPERPSGSDLRTQIEALNAKLDILLQLVKTLQHTPVPKKEEHKEEIAPVKKAIAKAPEKKPVKKIAKK